MNEIQQLQQNALNQSKYIADTLNTNITDISKKSMQYNPFASLQYSWQVAQARKTFVFFCTLPFIIGETYWNTFHEVYRAPATAPKGE